MDDDQAAAYRGAETTGFQSPAQDHIELVVDLSRLLDLGKPGVYPVRVSGQALDDTRAPFSQTKKKHGQH